jgi:hypothetical protein
VTYAVNTGESADVVEAFVARHGVKLAVLRDPEGRVWRDVDGRGLPANLFWSIDMRRTDVGPRDYDAWCAAFEAAGVGPGG